MTVSEAVKMPKSTTFRYLSTLRERGYATYDESTKMYRLGPNILGFRDGVGDGGQVILASAAGPILEALRDELSETTNLGVLDGTMVRHLIVCESPHRMRLAARVGERAYLHTTALGKVVLAQLDDPQAAAVLESAGLPQLTDATTTAAETVLAELREVRECGFAVDNNENQPDGRCVAVPLAWHGIRAGISVSAPDSRLPLRAVPGIASRLRDIARQLNHCEPG